MSDKNNFNLVSATIVAIYAYEFAASLHPDYKISRGILFNGVAFTIANTLTVLVIGLLIYFDRYIAGFTFFSLLAATFGGSSIFVYWRYQREREYEAMDEHQLQGRNHV